MAERDGKASGKKASGHGLKDMAGAASHVAARGGKRAASAVGGAAVSTGAVLSGTDIRAFNDFTNAVTRVVVGLHESVSLLKQENADLSARIAALEAAAEGA